MTGCCAVRAADYVQFRPFFEKVLLKFRTRDAAPMSAAASSWVLGALDQPPLLDGMFDLNAVGITAMPVQLNCSRNMVGFPLPAAMSRADRVHLERIVGSAIKRLVADGMFGGEYWSLTPGHPRSVTQQSLTALLKSKALFEPLVNRPDFKASGVAGDWSVESAHRSAHDLSECCSMAVMGAPQPRMDGGYLSSINFFSESSLFRSQVIC